MKEKYRIKLQPKDKKSISELLKKGSEKARTLTRCRILLLVDSGQSKKKIQESLSIDLKTISNVSQKYAEEGLKSAIYEKPRPGAPTIFDGKLKAKITALACSTPPVGYSKWSLRLLSDKAVELEYVDSISHTEVGNILKKTR